LKEPDLALADYNAALNIQADSPGVLGNRAWIYITRNQFDLALEDLNKAIGLFPPAAAAMRAAIGDTLCFGSRNTIGRCPI
jgi:tetratricopeptide (TPR) repeat protein